MAAKKRARRSTAKMRPGKYRGLLVIARAGARTKSKKSVAAGQVLLAIDDAFDNGWVPVLYMGRVEFVQQADITRARN